jgi:hypothetical protein
LALIGLLGSQIQTATPRTNVRKARTRKRILQVAKRALLMCETPKEMRPQKTLEIKEKWSAYFQHEDTIGEGECDLLRASVHRVKVRDPLSLLPIATIPHGDDQKQDRSHAGFEHSQKYSYNLPDRGSSQSVKRY